MVLTLGDGPFGADLIREAQQHGQTRPGIDPDHEGQILMSIFTGLSLSTLAGLTTAKEAVRAIDYHLDQLFTDGVQRNQ